MIPKLIKHITMAVVMTAFFVACSSQKNADEYPKPHFDIKGLIKDQVAMLKDQNVEVSKKTIFQGDSALRDLKDVDWEDELLIFNGLDINKPAIAPLYDSVINDTIIFRPIKDKDLTSVKTLKILKNDDGKVLRISGIIEEKNYLYQMHKELLMEINPESGLLQHYKIWIRNKVITKDEEFSKVEGTIKS